MNVSACILIVTLMIVWLCPYQINKWNYDFCLCYRYCDTSALPGWGVTETQSEFRSEASKLVPYSPLMNSILNLG
ncbi:hypothetical protein Hanom_Chr01g00011041 [Helianthus anomalus]